MLVVIIKVFHIKLFLKFIYFLLDIQIFIKVLVVSWPPWIGIENGFDGLFFLLDDDCAFNHLHSFWDFDVGIEFMTEEDLIRLKVLENFWHAHDINNLN